jgi:hypothetical protein
VLVACCFLAPVEVVSDRDELRPVLFGDDDQRTCVVADGVGSPRVIWS